MNMQKEKSYVKDLLSDKSRGTKKKHNYMHVCVYLVTEQYVYSCRPLPVHLINEG